MLFESNKIICYQTVTVLAGAISLTVFCCLEILASLNNEFSVTKCIHFLWDGMAIDIFLPN